MEDGQSPLVKLNLRMREETRDELAEAAERSGRSLNNEIVMRLEASLRADKGHGGGTQALLVRNVVDVMDGVSASFGRPWWESYASWWLVFRSAWYLFRRSRPELPDPLQKRVSSKARAAIKAWENTHEPNERRLELVRERAAQLRLTRKVLNRITDEEALELINLEKEMGQAEPPDPQLDGEDLAEWRRDRSEKRQSRAAWSVILPILTAARTRARR